MSLGVGTYRIRIMLFIKVANNTMKLKAGYDFTGSGTVICDNLELNYDGGSIFGAYKTGQSLPRSASPGTFNSPGGYFAFDLVLNVTATGTFSVQWAQQVSNASNATVLAGSTIEYA
jgi:hypothetical protein